MPRRQPAASSAMAVMRLVIRMRLISSVSHTGLWTSPGPCASRRPQAREKLPPRAGSDPRLASAPPAVKRKGRMVHAPRCSRPAEAQQGRPGRAPGVCAERLHFNRPSVETRQTVIDSFKRENRDKGAVPAHQPCTGREPVVQRTPAPPFSARQRPPGIRRGRASHRTSAKADSCRRSRILP